MIYKPIRKLELEKLEIQEIYKLKEVLVTFRNRAAIMETYDDQESDQNQMISLANEQLIRVDKLIDDYSEEKEKSKRKEFNEKMINFQKTEIILAAIAATFAIIAVIITLISLFR